MTRGGGGSGAGRRPRGTRGGGRGRGRAAADPAKRDPLARETRRRGPARAGAGGGASGGGRGRAAAEPAKRDPLAREPRRPGSARAGGGGGAAAPAAGRRARGGRGGSSGAGRGRARGGAGAARRPRAAPGVPPGGGSVVSAGAVIFRDAPSAAAGRGGGGRSRGARGGGRAQRPGRPGASGIDSRRYLLLHYPSGHWDFVKGKVEEGESLYETVVREAREETGISDLEFVGGFDETVRYEFRSEGRPIRKKVVFYLARTGTEEVALSDEHVAYDWLGFRDCLDRATFDNAKAMLLRAEGLLLLSPPPSSGPGDGGEG